MIFFFPYIASIVAVCTCWNYLLFKYGPVNSFLNYLGFKHDKVLDAIKDLAIWSLIIVNVWRHAGYYMIMYIAGLQGISKDLYEAATVDGANAWQKFRKITLPMLTPTTFFVSIMLTITCFKMFDIVVLMTEGGPGPGDADACDLYFRAELYADQVRSGQFGRHDSVYPGRADHDLPVQG